MKEKVDHINIVNIESIKRIVELTLINQYTTPDENMDEGKIIEDLDESPNDE